MSENAATSNDLSDPRPYSGIAYSGTAAGFVLLLAFLLRLWKASGTFLNLDEAMHCLTATKPSLAEAYRASLGLAHPPLLILLLNLWQRFGTSELFLRLPSVIAGTIFCWIFFKWLTRLLGPAAGWTGFVLVSFLPPFVELSAEIRQYAMLLCFLIAAAYFLELAFAENSGKEMLLFFFFLYLAMLTHFSAILFAGAVGVYSLWRLFSAPVSRTVATMWIAGQAGALGLFVYLYITQIAALKDSASSRNMQMLLANSYFHRGHDHLLSFIFARTFGVVQYTFGQLAVGDVAGVLFIYGIALLLNAERIEIERINDPRAPSSRQLGIFLTLPFVMNCLAAIVDLYPYGGTRHSAFLLPFAVAAVSVALAKLTRQRLAYALCVAFLVAAVCQVSGAPHRPYIPREDQRLAHMTEAIAAIRQQVRPGDAIFVDFQTSFLLRFYLCPEVGYGVFSAAGLRQFSCGGENVIATDAETNVLTAQSLVHRLDDVVKTYDLRAGQTVWIFQAGWDANLARELQETFPDFQDLQPESFGHNISLFKLTMGQPMARP